MSRRRQLRVPERSFIQWGRVYVLDTSQGAVIKRIYEHGDDILCRSINPDYADFIVRKTEIHGIFRVVGMIRTNV